MTIPVLRRRTLVGLAAALATDPATADDTKPDHDPGPIFSATGPDAERYGAAQAYPAVDPTRFIQPADPADPRYRVGAYSHFDEIHRTRRIARSTSPWPFERAPADIGYTYRGRPSSLTEYLLRNAVTGLLIAKDDHILFEHYQYARTDRDRFNSGSMSKTITAMLIGIAIADGAIASVDDPAEAYVPGLQGSEYGKTPIRDLLHMSSGVQFDEAADDGRDLELLWRDMVLGLGGGTIRSLTRFNHRVAPPGTEFAYASIEPDVLGLVLRHAAHATLSDYLHDKIWQPIGAEADAAWLVDAQGYEVAHSFFNAVLRDYARFARLLAHDGAWNGQQIIPAQWLIDATTVSPSDPDPDLAPGRASPGLGYGYLVWLLPGPRRQFVLLGDPGQRIFVDPRSKLVLVQTAVEKTDEVWRLWSALSRQFGPT